MVIPGCPCLYPTRFGEVWNVELVMGNMLALFLFLAVDVPLDTRCVLRNIIASSLAGRPLPCTSMHLGSAARKAAAKDSKHFCFGADHSRTILMISIVNCGSCDQRVHPTQGTSCGVTLSPASCSLGRIMMGPGHRRCHGGSGPTMRFIHRVVRRHSSRSPSRGSF